ncbi:MAG: T9SS type A sorting domain-containing protein [Bacteroidota bacterium]
MKITLSIALLFLGPLIILAQTSTFQIKDNNNNGQTVIDGAIFYHPTQNYCPTINHEFEIKNVSASTLSLSLRKYEDLLNTVNVNNNDIAQAYFCFGTNCLPASVLSYSIELAPGESTLLEAKFDEASIAGHSIIRFKFNNKVNTSDALTLTLKYDSNVGIIQSDKNAEAFFLVYPNPAKDILTISSEGGNTAAQQIQLLDAFGKTIIVLNQSDMSNTNKITLPLNLLSTGIYFLNIKTETQNFHKKIIIN